MELEDLVLRPAPLRSTGSACAQGRLLPSASCGPVHCVGVCIGLRVRVCQRRLRRFFCCFCLLPGPLPVNPRLLSPPPGYPCARPSYCLLMVVHIVNNAIGLLSVCYYGLHGPIAYSLLGVGVPIPEQLLYGTLDSISLRFKNHYVLYLL